MAPEHIQLPDTARGGNGGHDRGEVGGRGGRRMRRRVRRQNGGIEAGARGGIHRREVGWHHRWASGRRNTGAP